MTTPMPHTSVTLIDTSPKCCRIRQMTVATIHSMVPMVNALRKSTRTGFGAGLRALGSMIGANFMTVLYLGTDTAGNHSHS